MLGQDEPDLNPNPMGNCCEMILLTLRNEVHLISFLFIFTHFRQEMVIQRIAMAMETASAWLENHLRRLSNDSVENTS